MNTLAIKKQDRTLRGVGEVASARKSKCFFFSNIVFEFAGLVLSVCPCEGVRSLPPQTEYSWYGPVFIVQ